jgi:two-component system chemotaxis response regulator CheB
MEYNFNIVGIGLSAGGLAPLLEIVADFPENLNAAVVIITHMPANTPSNLDRILSKITPLKVIAVSTIEYIECGRIYVMAAGKEMILTDGFLQIMDRSPQQKINNTIDVFFKSLAADAKDKSIGVILSGAGHDGIEGARRIEDQNGLVIVQDPDTAQFSLMPGNLIANDHPDYVLSPKDIAKKIATRVL